MKKLKKEFGKHYLVELMGCDAEKIKFVKDVKGIFNRSAVNSRATIIDDLYFQFEPAGVSGVIFIAESHFSIHTWPQDNYVGFDILTCGEMDPEIAIEELKEGFGAKRMKVKVIPRGF